MKYVTEVEDLSEYNLTVLDEYDNKTVPIKEAKITFYVENDENGVDAIVANIETKDGILFWEDDDFTDQGIPQKMWDYIDDMLIAIKEEELEYEEVPGFGTMANFWKWKEG